jgi:hypothetical protein
VVATPSGCQQRSGRNDPAGMFYQKDQQIEFRRIQVQTLAANRGLMVVQIDAKVAGFQNLL